MDNDPQEPEEAIWLAYPRKWCILDRLEKTPAGLTAKDFTDLYFAGIGEHPWSYDLSDLKRGGHVRIAGLIQKRGERAHSVYVITPQGRKKIAEIRAAYGTG